MSSPESTDRRQQQQQILAQLLEALARVTGDPRWHGTLSLEVHIKDGRPIRVVTQQARSVML